MNRVELILKIPPDFSELNVSVPSEACQIVDFNLETSGFGKSAEILQIAARCENCSISIYINLTEAIDQKASKVTGLENIKGVLYFHNRKSRF